MSDITEEYFVWRLTTCGYAFREETVTNYEHDVQNKQILHTTEFFHRSKDQYEKYNTKANSKYHGYYVNKYEKLSYSLQLNLYSMTMVTLVTKA